MARNLKVQGRCKCKVRSLTIRPAGGSDFVYVSIQPLYPIMPRRKMVGFYDCRCAMICIDSDASRSRLSDHFVKEHKIGITVQNVSGVAYITCSAPVCILTIEGFFVSRFRIPVGSVKYDAHDVLLGADWIAASRPNFTKQGMANPSVESLRSLPNGHFWKLSLPPYLMKDGFHPHSNSATSLCGKYLLVEPSSRSTSPPPQVIEPTLSNSSLFSHK
jgi:hypothetical protein